MTRRRGKPKRLVGDVQHDAPNLGKRVKTIEEERPLDAARRPDLMLPIVLPPDYVGEGLIARLMHWLRRNT